MVPTAAQLEWWTGEKWVVETAYDLRIEEFTKGPRTIAAYRDYNRRYQARRAQEHRMWQRYWAQPAGFRNPWLRYRLSQRVQCRKRNKYWRMWSYPNLRKAWATRREQGRIGRELRERARRRAAIIKSLELYKYSTRKDI